MRKGNKRRINLRITVVSQLDTDTGHPECGTKLHLIKSIRLTIPAFETPDPAVGDDDDMSKEVVHTNYTFGSCGYGRTSRK